MKRELQVTCLQLKQIRFLLT